MDIRDKIKHIKYSRLSPQDRILTDIFNNLQEVKLDDMIHYLYNDKIVLKYYIKSNMMLYDNYLIHEPLSKMKLEIKDILDLMEKYIKIYFNKENTQPWRFNMKK